MSLEPNPACKEYCRLLKRLFAGGSSAGGGIDHPLPESFV